MNLPNAGQRIVFFGSGAFGLPTLEALRARHSLQAIVTQPDRPAGRSRKPTPTPVGVWADTKCADIPLYKPESVNTPDVVGKIRALNVDVFVVIAFGQKMSPSLLKDRFAINLHASLLPRWRGAAPINHAILAGDTQSGNSVIKLADRMDAGEILTQSVRPIEATTTAGELHDLLAGDGPELILRALEDFRCGTLRPRSQDPALVTIAGKLSRRDATVNWSDAAEQCARRINGLSPWPCVTVNLEGSPLRLLRAASESVDFGTIERDGGGTDLAPPGTLVDAVRGQVMCRDRTILNLIEVQPAGGRPMAWSAFAHGHKPTPGARLSGESNSC